MARRSLVSLLFALLAALLLSSASAKAQTPPAWNTLFTTAIPCSGSACRISSGPGCDTAAVPGQCSFPRTNAQALCVAHGACQALTCNAGRNDCQARDATESATSAPLAGFTSLRHAANAQATQPGWATQMGGAINCGIAGNPACRISSGPACNTAAVPGQCSFPAATAHASCVAHGSCRALNCSLTRGDCQARDAEEAKAWVPNAQALSFLAPTAQPGAPSTAALPGTPLTPLNLGTSGTSATPSASLGGVFVDAAELMKQLPLPTEFLAAAEALKTASEATDPGGRWAWRSSGDYTLFINITTFQTAILLVNRQINIPFGASYGLANTGFDTPFFVLSNIAGSLNKTDLPQPLQTVINSKLFGVSSLKIERGSTNFALAKIGGVPRDLLTKLLGAPKQPMGNTVDLSTRWAVARIDPPPETPPATTPADVFRNWLTSYKNELEANERLRNGTVTPTRQIIVEAQTPPNARWGQPLGMPSPEVSDATVYWDNQGAFGFIGNLHFNNKRALASYKGPLSVVQKLLTAASVPPTDLADVTFMLATPQNFTLKDFAQFYVELAAKLNLLPIDLSAGLNTMAAPLDLFAVRNTQGEPPAYKSGDDAPPRTRFNLAVIGPLATYNGKQGPYASLAGAARALGTDFANLSAEISTTGLNVTASTGMNVTPVSGVDLASMNLSTDIKLNAQQQHVKLGANFSVAGAGRTGSISLQPSAIDFVSAPTGAGQCLAPVTLRGNASFPNPQALAGFNLRDITTLIDWPDETALADSAGNVVGCGGYIWGKMRDGAMVAGNGIVYGGTMAGKAIVAGAGVVGGAVMGGVNAIVGGFNAVGDFFKDPGCAWGITSCPKKSGPPPELQVLDVGFYLAAHPDLRAAFGTNTKAASDHWLANGVKEGRQSATWFDAQYYFQRHGDLQQAYRNDPRRPPTPWTYAVWHWLNYGIKEGRRSSATFDVSHYFNSHADLKAAYANDRNPNKGTATQWAMWHYLTHGYKEKRQLAPDNWDPVRDPRMVVFNAAQYKQLHADVRPMSDFEAGLHWLAYGIKEGRQSSNAFDVKDYLQRYPDLQRAFGKSNYRAAVKHWLEFGQREGRNGTPFPNVGINPVPPRRLPGT